MIFGQIFTCEIEATLGQLGGLRAALSAPHTCCWLPAGVCQPRAGTGEKERTLPPAEIFKDALHVLLWASWAGSGLCPPPHTHTQANPGPLLPGTHGREQSLHVSMYLTAAVCPEPTELAHRFAASSGERFAGEEE